MRSFFTPEDGPWVSKHEGNKHQRNCAGCVLDYLLYTKHHERSLPYRM
jgi:hypothetical protein